MEWKRFRLLNNIVGWITFVISATVYLLTIGPSAALWDCPEFITTAHNLEVGHPPGAPFYMLVYNFASHLTSDPRQVALLCNIVSALLSAATILLLFWTITHMVRRVVLPTFEPYKNDSQDKVVSLSLANVVLILGCGLVGALAYTFSDTFWYSAVEAEVYAFSSFFTALVFWLMFLWEDRSHSLYSDRWIILIAYFMGLSIGVHLLNLLCIPAMALLFYYRKSKNPSTKGALLTLFVSAILILVMMIGVVRGVMKVGTLFDVFFVNTLGLPVNSGFYFFLILLAVSLGYSAYLLNKGESYTKAAISFIVCFVLMGIPFLTGSWLINLSILGAVIWWVLKKKVNLPLLQTIQMCMVVIMVGFSSYGVILVRSIANTPMNQNEPANAVALQKYLNRSQYGEIPHFYAPTFAAQPIPGQKDESRKEWNLAIKSNPKEKDRYEHTTITRAVYSSSDKMLFPRMHSSDASHIRGYNLWIDRDPNDLSAPTFGQNLRFFLSYQINYMYWRYFGWNFIGRQNDIQGHGGLLNGNVVTGIDFIDRIFIGPSKDMPLTTETNKGHNVYYMLPLLLGLLGIFFQLIRDRKGTQSFWIVFWLFFMTGLAIIFYINQTTGQPRERDYAYAGSFYAFAIWIGFGVAGLWWLLRKLKIGNLPASIVASVIGLIVPLQMASQNWDDHDRSGRVLASDFGYNFLESCEPNAVLFCFGDNDTFPLWYAQSVEGVRRDIRVCNLSYLQSDWYGKQMLKQSYASTPVPYKHITNDFFAKNLIALVSPGTASYDEAMTQMRQSAPSLQTPIIPASTLVLPLDTVEMQRLFPQIPQERRNSEMVFSLESMQYIPRDAYFVMDMIAASKFRRPLYWVSTMPVNSFNNLPEYLQGRGMTKKILPWRVADLNRGMDVDKTYDLVMNKYRYFNASDPDIYFDDNIRQTIAYYYRYKMFAELASALLDRGDTQRASKVLRKCHSTFSAQSVPYTLTDLFLAEAYYRAGMQKEGDEITLALLQNGLSTLKWMLRLRPRLLKQATLDGVHIDALRLIVFAKETADRGQSKALVPYESQITSLLKTFGGQ